jgi:hypothetical protein
MGRYQARKMANWKECKETRDEMQREQDNLYLDEEVTLFAVAISGRRDG